MSRNEWLLLVLAIVFVTAFGYAVYRAEEKTQETEAACRARGGEPARVREKILCFAPEVLR